jgi:hypothetical protein
MFAIGPDWCLVVSQFTSMSALPPILPDEYNGDAYVELEVERRVRPWHTTWPPSSAAATR